MALTDKQIQNIKLLLQVQAEGYNDAINRMHNDFKEIRKDYDLRFVEFQRSLEYTQKENEDLKSDILSLRADYDKLKAEMQLQRQNIHHINSFENEFQQKIDYIDDKQRKNNIIISGVTENQNENIEQCRKKVLDVLKEKLQIQSPQIDSVHRIGKPSAERKNRDILMKFSNIEQKEAVLRNKKNLKGLTLFINEDYCKNTVEIRKKLFPKVREARQKGMQAYVNYRDLIIRPARENLGSRQQGNKPIEQSVMHLVNNFEQSKDDAQELLMSPLPSPLQARASPRTPPINVDTFQNDENKNNVTHLRPRNNVKYPK